MEHTPASDARMCSWNPGVPHGPQPAQLCWHGSAVLSHPSRASHWLGSSRSTEHSMALHASACSLGIDGSCAVMTLQVAESSGTKPPTRRHHGYGRPGHTQRLGADVAAPQWRAGHREVATSESVSCCASDHGCRNCSRAGQLGHHGHVSGLQCRPQR